MGSPRDADPRNQALAAYGVAGYLPPCGDCGGVVRSGDVYHDEPNAFIGWSKDDQLVAYHSSRGGCLWALGVETAASIKDGV